MEEFFTQDAANEGTKIHLYRPDGTKTDHFLVIHSVDSDAYHLANAQERRATARVELEAQAIEDKAAREEFIFAEYRKAEIRVLASLVKSWSFDEEPTMANKVNFLTKAPQIAEQVNRLSGQRRLFIKTG